VRLPLLRADTSRGRDDPLLKVRVVIQLNDHLDMEYPSDPAFKTAKVVPVVVIVDANTLADSQLTGTTIISH